MELHISETFAEKSNFYWRKKNLRKNWDEKSQFMGETFSSGEEVSRQNINKHNNDKVSSNNDLAFYSM